MQKYIRNFARCFLLLVFVSFCVFVSKSQQQKKLKPEKINRLDSLENQAIQNQIPLGLFAYNKWVDLNENDLVESNEFFGLGKKSFSKGEAISASLHDPNLRDGVNLKLRIWDTSGNLIRTLKRTYTSTPLFSYSGFDSFLPVGDYILTINPEESVTTFQIRFSLKEPNGDSFASIRKKLLPENLYIFKQWMDEDGDMKMDSTEVVGLNQNEYVLGNVDFELCLNLPFNQEAVVYQIWDGKHQLMSMNISKLDSLQHYSMKVDSLNGGNEFLRVLCDASAGDYFITASLSDKELKQYKLLVQLVDTTEQIKPEILLAEVDTSQLDSVPVLTENSIPEVPKVKLAVMEQVDNLAPDFTKGQEGFFVFTGFIDSNENNMQERNEFMGTAQNNYNSESENIFVQFHLGKFYNNELSLQILNENNEMLRQQTGYYSEYPFVFKVSMPDEPLPAGNYKLVLKVGDFEVNYSLEIAIK